MELIPPYKFLVIKKSCVVQDFFKVESLVLNHSSTTNFLM